MLGLFRNKDRERQTEALYAPIVGQARQPAFFLDYGVPDTPDGRYGLMVLHVFLFAWRLREADLEAKRAAQQVCDRFFAEMDQALRDLGVGDMSVPKRIRKVAGFYAGASEAYAQALASGSEVDLAAALVRNVYIDADGAGARHLAAYTVRAASNLADTPVTTLLAGRVPFPDPRTVEKAGADPVLEPTRR